MSIAEKKHLHELLEDEQEPFHLNHYISDLRTQMGCSDLRLVKQKQDSVSAFPHAFFSCESSCFFASTHKSPDPRKSPLFELRSSPGKKSQVFLKIPARTAAILLEAAVRIQKQQSEKKTNKARNRGNGFGLFGSVLKRLTNRKTKLRSDNNADANVISSEPTSSSSQKCFCDSPFHFVLQTTTPTSSSGHRTPHFTSTATSPARPSTQDEDSDETGSIEKVREQEEEDKDEEQCSPVSVLDPLEEEEEDHHHHHEGQEEPPHHNLILSCSFEVVQRAKRRLLKKLRRFEKLAGLDPVELERKMSSSSSSEGEEYEEESEEEEDDNIRVYDSDEEYEDVDEAMARESQCVEEERKKKKKNDERQKKWRMMTAWRVGLAAEEDVVPVVRKDMREEAGEWTRHRVELEEAVSDVELSIFVFLIDELSNELISSFLHE